jgi:hypothetical protein
VRHLDQAYGWIPLGCITGDTDHFPPTDRMHFLTTPIADQHCASFERMDAVKESSYLNDCSSSSSDSSSSIGEHDSFDDDDSDSGDYVDDIPEGVFLGDPNPIRRPIDDDREFVNLVNEKIRRSGGAAPRHPASCVPIFTLDGRASNMQEWMKGVISSEEIIHEAVAGLVDKTGNQITPVIVRLTDHQEFKDAHDSRHRMQLARFFGGE